MNSGPCSTQSNRLIVTPDRHQADARRVVELARLGRRGVRLAVLFALFELARSSRWWSGGLAGEGHGGLGRRSRTPDNYAYQVYHFSLSDRPPFPLYSFGRRPGPSRRACRRGRHDTLRFGPVQPPNGERAGHHGFRIKHHVHDAPAIGRP